MTRPILAWNMPRTTEKLAGKNAGRGRPALCDLRRATSTAYYALFHQIIRHGAYASVPTADEDEVALLTRWFSHGGVRTAADLTMKASAGRPSDDSAIVVLRTTSGRSVPPELVLVAESFIALQKARHAADYGNDYDPVRWITLEHVALADRALRATWSMWRASWSPRSPRLDLHDSYHRFPQLSMLKSGGPKNR